MDGSGSARSRGMICLSVCLTAVETVGLGYFLIPADRPGLSYCKDENGAKGDAGVGCCGSDTLFATIHACSSLVSMSTAVIDTLSPQSRYGHGMERYSHSHSVPKKSS